METCKIAIGDSQPNLSQTAVQAYSSLNRKKEFDTMEETYATLHIILHAEK